MAEEGLLMQLSPVVLANDENYATSATGETLVTPRNT